MALSTKRKKKAQPVQAPEMSQAERDEIRSKLDANTKAAADKIERARMQAVGEQSAARVFFTTCALRLVPTPSRHIPTMATDGYRMYYNPEFTLSLSDAEVHGVSIGHETAHCFMEHFPRGSGFANKYISNLAMDLEINPILREAGYKLPDCAIFPGEGKAPFNKLPKDQTFEIYYRILHDMIPPDQQSGGENDDPGGCGGILEPTDEAGQSEVEQRWKEIIAAAAQEAATRGSMPGSLQRIIDSALKPKYNPWDSLQQYLTRTAKAETNWARCNRRYLARGMYLPGKQSLALGELVIMFDLSGSITDEQARMMAWVMQSAMERMPGKLTVLYHDVPVQKVVEWEPGGEDLKFEACGGGGTSHLPVFKAVEELGLEPDLIIAVTDMMSEFPQHCQFPTLWLKTIQTDATAPFGDYISLV